MIDAVWLHVLHRIPADYHDAIAIVTVTGAELVLQQIYKLERDFMVIRARTAGTMDTGRTIIVAYAQIDFLAFNRKIADEEIAAMFQDPMPELAVPAAVAYVPAAAPVVAPPVVPAARPATPPHRPASAPTTPVPEAAPAATDDAPPPAKPGQVSKTILLARLRERLAEKAK